jgi:hypothetical protein
LYLCCWCYLNGSQSFSLVIYFEEPFSYNSSYIYECIYLVLIFSFSLPKNSNDRGACLTLSTRNTYKRNRTKHTFFLLIFFSATQETTCHAYLCSLLLFLSLYFPYVSLIFKHRLVVHWYWCVCHKYNSNKVCHHH